MCVSACMCGSCVSLADLVFKIPTQAKPGLMSHIGGLSPLQIAALDHMLHWRVPQLKIKRL